MRLIKIFRIRPLVLIITFLFISSLSFMPAEAINVPYIFGIGVNDLSVDCSNLIVEVQIERTAGGADGTANGLDVDFYYIVVFDGYGNPHYADDLAVVYPSSGTITPQINDRHLGAFFARPARIAVYDVITGGHFPLNEIQDYPIVASTTFDPALFAPNCNDIPFVQDTRINRLDLEPWQTVAIYCERNGTIDIYRINQQSQGYLVIHLTRDDIDAVGVPTFNTLIATSEDGVVRLYRLNSGEYQVIAPRDAMFDGYIYRWQEGDCRF